MILGLHHVTAISGNAQENLDFYAGVLGLASVGRPDPNRAIYAVGAGQRLHVESGLAAGEDERLAHVAFMTPDVPALPGWYALVGPAKLDPKVTQTLADSVNRFLNDPVMKQKLTDQFIADMDRAGKEKEAELMEV